MFKNKGVDKKQVKQLEEQSAQAQALGELAGAALYNIQAAQLYREENELIAAHYSHAAMRLYLKAKLPAQALAQAIDTFEMLNNTGWLDRSMEEVLELMEMINELRQAGSAGEAGQLARMLNQKLGELGLMLKPESSPQQGPVICPACGANVPEEESQCQFCGRVVPR